MCWIEDMNIPIMGQPGFPRPPHVLASLRACYKKAFDFVESTGLGLGYILKQVVGDLYPARFRYYEKKEDPGTLKVEFEESHDAGNDVVATLMSFIGCILKGNNVSWNGAPPRPTLEQPWRIFVLDCDCEGASDNHTTRQMTLQSLYRENANAACNLGYFEADPRSNGIRREV
ncbi:hypothetical protein FB567DRAFT_550354 [Paraphoma chrysanthemicola]|uniref:Uncharacterized protein n=1 Tax=Paraphoma chrysanthemicola TaxID=798071 RepID=A0A8K0R3H4_9PLEO|nr:hypothetical protein FB567DRAFT_550354 [Paraphoma chrysanthemicola]